MFLAQKTESEREWKSLNPKILAGYMDKGTQHWHNTAVWQSGVLVAKADAVITKAIRCYKGDCLSWIAKIHFIIHLCVFVEKRVGRDLLPVHFGKCSCGLISSPKLFGMDCMQQCNSVCFWDFVIGEEQLRRVWRINWIEDVFYKWYK